MLKEYRRKPDFKKIGMYAGIVLAVLLVGGFIYHMATKPAPVSQVVCVPKEKNVGNNNVKIKVDKDGKTITHITYTEGITKKMLEDQNKKGGITDGNTQQDYYKQLAYYLYRYRYVNDGNEGLKWLNVKFNFNEGLQQISLVVDMDLTNKTFKKYKENKNYLAFFGLDTFYNEKKNTYEYSADKAKDMMTAAAKLECSGT